MDAARENDLVERQQRYLEATIGQMNDDLYPTLRGTRVTIRPGDAGDVDALQAILAEPSVVRWWGTPESREETAAKLSGADSTVLLVVEIAGEVAGGIEYSEEPEPMFRHAGIDIYLATRWQGHGHGSEAVGLLTRFLFDGRGHHRLVIDPAVQNAPAVAAYTRAGFRPVGIMRQYQQLDGHWYDGLLMDLLRDDVVL